MQRRTNGCCAASANRDTRKWLSTSATFATSSHATDHKSGDNTAVITAKLTRASSSVLAAFSLLCGRGSVHSRHRAFNTAHLIVLLMRFCWACLPPSLCALVRGVLCLRGPATSAPGMCWACLPPSPCAFVPGVDCRKTRDAATHNGCCEQVRAFRNLAFDSLLDSV